MSCHRRSRDGPSVAIETSPVPSAARAETLHSCGQRSESAVYQAGAEYKVRGQRSKYIRGLGFSSQWLPMHFFFLSGLSYHQLLTTSSYCQLLLISIVIMGGYRVDIATCVLCVVCTYVYVHCTCLHTCYNYMCMYSVHVHVTAVNLRANSTSEKLSRYMYTCT